MLARLLAACGRHKPPTPAPTLAPRLPSPQSARHHAESLLDAERRGVSTHKEQLQLDLRSRQVEVGTRARAPCFFAPPRRAAANCVTRPLMLSACPAWSTTRYG